MRVTKLNRRFVEVALLGWVVGLGCANVSGAKPGDGTDGGTGPKADGPNAIVERPPPIERAPINLANCGNGALDSGETCDDGNKKAGDGCSDYCQIEVGYTCPNPGQPCNPPRCGDGNLTANEACDDGNTNSGDGCSSDCQTVETGYQCRVPGKKCNPLCGDGMQLGTEGCDDGNTMDGDGCSSTCLVEPGADCSGSPSKCTIAVCGDGNVQKGETCDCGTDPTKLPSGCPGPNGLFIGDGSGCSKTCTKEPTCRSGTGTVTTGACNTTCGNGAIETGEGCDDGNLVDGDGCSKTCMPENGFSCSTQMKPDTVPCTQPGNSGDCLELPIIYRDFKNESVSGGHPDFFYLGATVPNPVSITGVTGQSGAVSFSKRYCVPNSSGPAKQNDSVDRCWDLATPNLDPKGKPVFNSARPNGTNCNCQFIDWSHDGNGGRVPGAMPADSPTYGLPTYVNGSGGHPMYRGLAPIVSSAATFGTWWTDNMYTGNTHTVGTLEMAAFGTAGQYQYSSQPNSVLGGFFPLDPANQFPIYGPVTKPGPGTVTMVGTEKMLCNLWPYWNTGSASFGTGCSADQYLFPPSLMTTMAPPYMAANWNTTLNTMDAKGVWFPTVQGWYHDSWFSDEARYLFNYTGDFGLQFYGDDDMYIYINGILVVDLGGVHQRLPGRVDVKGGIATITEGGSLDPTGTMILPCATSTLDPYTMKPFNTLTGDDANGHMNCTISTCDCRTRTVDLKMMTGNTYEIAVFGADRHPTESNYQLTLSGFSTNKTVCMPVCGDGVVSGAEECDDGPNNMDGVYGACTKDCKYGPFCGDNNVDSPPEECDLGRNNGATYSATKTDGCSTACTFPHYCGDGNLDPQEQCDLGAMNGTTVGQGMVGCDMNCKAVIP